ncbi:Transposase DDE domain protein [compost metagenome]
MKALLDKVREITNGNRVAAQANLILTLNPVIRGLETGASPCRHGSQCGRCHSGDQTGPWRENAVCADAGYTGVEKRKKHEGRSAIWQIAARRSTYQKYGKRHVLYRVRRKIVKAKAQVRAKVEHPSRVIKQQFGYVKVRFRGLAKNTAQLVTLFALSNLWMDHRHVQANKAFLKACKASKDPTEFLKFRIGLVFLYIIP